MKVLIDTDVLIDVAMDRLPHVENSAWVLDNAQKRKYKAYLA